MNKKKIMVIDDNITNLNIARKALENEYEVLLLLSGVKALKVLNKTVPDLILLDVEMPDMNGFEVLEKIKELGKPFNEVPIIFVTARDDTNSEFEGLDLGAVDYVTKPYSFALLLKRVELHLKMAQQQKEIKHYSNNLEMIVSNQVSTIQNLQNAIVHTMSDMVERRDGSTGDHLIRTSEYLKILLNEVHIRKLYASQLNGISIMDYARASRLHDLGKIVIPDAILLKPGKLADEEFETMKTHTTVGEEAIQQAMQMVDDSHFLNLAADFIGAHHEKWDGSGYPRGLKGEAIPICGRLMAIVDVYDALISDRPYKKAFTHEEAKQIILNGRGTHFDPILTDVFKDVHLQFEETSIKYKEVEFSNMKDLC